MNVSITETQLRKLTQGLSEDLEYNHVDDASPENDEYEIGKMRTKLVRVVEHLQEHVRKDYFPKRRLCRTQIGTNYTIKN